MGCHGLGPFSPEYFSTLDVRAGTLHAQCPRLTVLVASCLTEGASLAARNNRGAEVEVDVSMKPAAPANAITPSLSSAQAGERAVRVISESLLQLLIKVFNCAFSIHLIL